MQRISLLRAESLRILFRSKRKTSDPARPIGEDFTLRLPPEILITVFSLLGRNSTALIRATAVCSRWRSIAVQTPYLWTQIRACLRGYNKKQVKSLLCRLDVFLARAGDSLLTVTWTSHVDTDTRYIPLFYNLFRERGSFIRWKSLDLGLLRGTTHEFGVMRDIDKFSNLEYLRLRRSPPPSYLELISSTVTPTLRTLVIARNVHCQPELTSAYERILACISTLKYEKGATMPAVTLPSNVTTIDSWAVPQLNLQYIRQLLIGRSVPLEQLSSPDFSSLTTLSIVIPAAPPDPSLKVVLPKLTHLDIHSRSFLSLAALDTPILSVLTIGSNGKPSDTMAGSLMEAFRSGFRAPTLTMLLLQIPVDRSTVLEIFSLFPYLQLVRRWLQVPEYKQKISAFIFPGGYTPNLSSGQVRSILHPRTLGIVVQTPTIDDAEWVRLKASLSPGLGYRRELIKFRTLAERAKATERANSSMTWQETKGRLGSVSRRTLSSV